MQFDDSPPEDMFPDEYLQSSKSCCKNIFDAIVQQHDTCFMNYLNSYYTDIDYYDSNYRGTALYYALCIGNENYASMIIHHGAKIHNIDNDGNNILSKYILSSYLEFDCCPNYDIICLLMKYGIKIQDHIIIFLLKHKEYAVIRLFIHQGIDPRYIEMVAYRENMTLCIDLGIDDITQLCENMTVS